MEYPFHDGRGFYYSWMWVNGYTVIYCYSDTCSIAVDTKLKKLMYINSGTDSIIINKINSGDWKNPIGRDENDLIKGAIADYKGVNLSSCLLI